MKQYDNIVTFYLDTEGTPHKISEESRVTNCTETKDGRVKRSKYMFITDPNVAKLHLASAYGKTVSQ